MLRKEYHHGYHVHKRRKKCFHLANIESMLTISLFSLVPSITLSDFDYPKKMKSEDPMQSNMVSRTTTTTIFSENELKDLLNLRLEKQTKLLHAEVAAHF